MTSHGADAGCPVKDGTVILGGVTGRLYGLETSVRGHLHHDDDRVLGTPEGVLQDVLADSHLENLRTFLTELCGVPDRSEREITALLGRDSRGVEAGGGILRESLECLQTRVRQSLTERPGGEVSQRRQRPPGRSLL